MVTGWENARDIMIVDLFRRSFRQWLPVAWQFPVAALGMALLPASATGAAESPTDIRSTPPAATTAVEVGGFIIDVVKISGADQLFTADVSMIVRWKDPRALTEKGPGTFPRDDVWHPLIAIANTRSTKTMLPDVVEIDPDGSMTYRQRISGDFSARFDLHDFPKDKQTIAIHFVARGKSADQVRLVPMPDLTGQAEEFTISDWAIGKVHWRVAPYVLPGLGKELPGIKFEFEATRLVGYYIGTIVVTAAIILCMASLVFWLGIGAINPRISVSVTSMLTLVAHRFVVQSQLPRLPYLTRMDYFLLGAALLVLLGLVGVVAVNSLAEHDKEKAVRLNKLLRWLQPVALVGLLVAIL